MNSPSKGAGRVFLSISQNLARLAKAWSTFSHVRLQEQQPFDKSVPSQTKHSTCSQLRFNAPCKACFIYKPDCRSEYKTNCPGNVSKHAIRGTQLCDPTCDGGVKRSRHITSPCNQCFLFKLGTPHKRRHKSETNGNLMISSKGAWSSVHVAGRGTLTSR